MKELPPPEAEPSLAAIERRRSHALGDELSPGESHEPPGVRAVDQEVTDTSDLLTILDRVADPAGHHRPLAIWLPVAAALAYPWTLAGFHQAIASKGQIAAPLVWLAASLALPLWGLVFARRATRPNVRRLSFLSLAAPPLFVLVGVVSGLVHSPVRDLWPWSLAWLGAGGGFALAGRAVPLKPAFARPRRLRVAHGVAAALILLFVAFHLANHLAGLVGPEAHARVMAIGRSIYRSTLVEPVLVLLLLFQVVSGIRMAWRWSARQLGWFNVLQVGSGVYLAAFVLTHLNSAFVSARWIHGIQTDWGWATGAPEGLLMDSWNIRLLPHYALGVFFVIAHLFCGLCTVLSAHGATRRTTNLIFTLGMLCAGGISSLIAAVLCGGRL